MFWEGPNWFWREPNVKRIHFFPCSAIGVMLKINTFWGCHGLVGPPLDPPVGTAAPPPGKGCHADGQARSKPGVRCYQLAEYVTGVEMGPRMSQFTRKLVPFHYSVPLPMHVQKTGTEPFTIRSSFSSFFLQNININGKHLVSLDSCVTPIS